MGAKSYVLLTVLCMVWPLFPAWAGDTNTPPTAAQPIGKLLAIQVLERDSHKPLADLPVEIIATQQIWCIKAPCPQGEQKKWRGTTDAKGVLHFPENLGIASTEVYVHALGTDAYANVQGYGKHDAQGRPIVLLFRPRPTHQ
jgi:hypothetical protein